MKILVVILVLPFVLAVASRCSGEAGWPGGTHLCACTVSNRLDHGWSEETVLRMYYAKDQSPTAEQISATESGLENEDCPEDAYFLFDRYDVNSLGLNLLCATGRSSNNGKDIWTFPYTTFKETKCYASDIDK